MLKNHFSRQISVHSGKVFRNTLLSYVAICTFLVFFSFSLNYLFLYQRLKQELYDSQNSMISVFKENIVSQFKSLDEIVSLIRTDPEMISSLGYTDYGYYKNSQRLLGYLSITNNLIDIFVYNRGQDRLFSSIGGASVKDYFDTYYHYNQLTSSDMIDFLNNTHTKTLSRLLSLNSYKNPGKLQNCVLYIVPTSNSRKIVFVIEEDFFTDNIKKYFSDEEITLSILNLQQDVLLTIGPHIVVNQELLSDFINGDTSTLTQKTETGYTTLISGPYNEWIFCLNYTVSDYNISIRFINIIIVGLLILVVCIGGILSFFATHLSYKPIKKLYKTIPETSLGHKQNEIEAIEHYLYNITAQNIEMSQKLDKEYSLMLRTMINAVMNGNISYSKNANIFQNSCYAIKHQWFCVVVYTALEGPAQQLFLDSLVIKASNADVNSNIILIKNIDHKIVSVILNSENYDELNDYAYQFCKKISDECNTPAAWGIGSRYNSPDNLSMSYSRALIALTSSGGKAGISFYAQTKQLLNSNLSLIAECKQYIQNAVRTMDIVSLPSYLESVLSRPHSVDLQMLYYSNIISTLLILCEQYDAPISSPDDYLLIPHYSQEKLIKNALSLCSKLCKHLEILSQQADQQLAKDIIHFITINISDINLSSQMIAEHFNCSLSYLNKYFKALIGTTPTAYIDKKRLSTAAALVIDSDLQIKEICCQVGYCDVNNFIRKFKKTYGTSPLQYRRQSLK